MKTIVQSKTKEVNKLKGLTIATLIVINILSFMF